MLLGTLDRTPPPFFRQGTSALTKLVFFAALALFLMVADTRLKMSAPIREALAIVLLPAQRVLMVPAQLLGQGGGYFAGLRDAQAAEARARAQLVLLAERASAAERLKAENQQLRALLDMKPGISVRSQAAEVMYEAADPFSRRVFINVGKANNIKLGSPVINERGVLGQVTRLYALSSEVTLLADREAAVPVINARTQQRSAAFGGVVGGVVAAGAQAAAAAALLASAQGASAAPAPTQVVGAATMELRFMSGNADVQVGDELFTSGLDGIYPPGLAVGKVALVDRRVESSFARVLLTPTASPDAVRHVLVLQPVSVQLPERPEPTPEAAGKRPRVNTLRERAP